MRWTRSLSLGLLALLVTGFPAIATANVRLPAVIGSNMVLQQGKPLTFWGWSDPDEAVTVELDGKKQSTKGDAAGNWSVKFEPLTEAGKSVEMTVTGKNSLKLTNILVGEVWLGSGQSNMQWSVSASLNAPQEIAAAKFPKIRLFLVPLVPSGTPAKDVVAQWVECDPKTVPGFSAVLYFFGREIHQKLDLPVGLIATSWGGTRIEPWIPPVSFETLPELKNELAHYKALKANYRKQVAEIAPQLAKWAADVAASPEGAEVPPAPALPGHPINSSGSPTGLYNGMIHPVVPFAMQGALWYQGESNRGAGMHYAEMMKGLISGWRTVWGQGEFPFLFVQLAPFRYGNNPTWLPEIWEAQQASLAIPSTGMAVTTDIGNVNDIHPNNKQEVSRRLSLWALRHTYGKTDLEFSGPVLDKAAFDGGKATLSFKHAAGLKSRDDKPLSWFTIAGEDKKFVPAEAKIEGETVVVSSPEVAKPVAVRFGWDELAEPNLCNGAGLPASPFRTDHSSK
jgi:sialate O-acetylesterase